ncbi:hypothetical protein H072_2773 [Dactylellina haptotyla CBS 200.50]|uniref:ribonuclease Z n=1 Tax=Dactylellina haptotyla (strain CBS 200.50) TaxID=1284197 RepID=S8C6D1_DACHA|nr:hypothetical protein H072_2773 [Dactylellina haptotyla CBS 200.50]
MKAFLEFVAIPTRDNGSTLVLLHLDERRYLFGHIAEGSQRLFNEHTIKVQRVSDIFISGKTEWTNNGGLVGLLLTMGDMKTVKAAIKPMRPKKPGDYMLLNADGTKVNPFPPPEDVRGLMVHGGKNMMHTVATTRNFVYREQSGVEFHEFDFSKGNDTFKDEFITVTPLRTFPRTGVANEELAMQDMEDLDLGAREVLENVVKGMWNNQSGGLNVGKDDEDYVISMIQRLKEDEQRARLERDRKPTQKNPADTETEGESPPKRQKLDSENAKSSTEDSAWDDILGDEPDKPHMMPTFPDSRPLRRPWPAATVKSLPGTLPSVSSLSYIINFGQVRGKFRVDLAKKFGLTPNPHYRILTEGKSVTLDDGTVVHPDQCMDPPKHVNGFAFLDIPDEEFIESTIESIKQWKEDVKAQGGNDVIGYWIWAVGSDIEKNERLLGYIQTLEGQHIVNSRTSPFEDLSFKGSSAQIARLNLLSPQIFPLACPGYDYISTKTDKLPTTEDKIIQVRDSLVLDIHPTPGVLTYKTHPQFNPSVIQKDAQIDFGNGRYWKSTQEAQYRISYIKNKWENISSASDEVEILTLGTGSAMPSKYRNVSATIVTVPEFGHLLLDSGESTYNQLLRAYGTRRAGFIKALRVLYISHLHADHHLGTISVLKAWYQERRKQYKDDQQAPKLYLIAPPKYLNFLEEYAQIEDFGLKDIKFVSCEALLIDSQRPQDANIPELTQRVEEMMTDLSLKTVQTSRAVHCRGSYTVAFTFKSFAEQGFKVAYSGDTRPTDGFIEIGKDCTVLIHEATFDDILSDQALAKKHCTTSEAIQAGKDMGAKNLLLTHFSQRYPKLPSVRREPPRSDDEALSDPHLEAPEEREPAELAQSDKIKITPKKWAGPVVSKPAVNSMNIGFAFDLMRVKVKDFWQLERFIPPLRLLFEEEVKIEPSDEKDWPNAEKKAKKVKGVAYIKPTNPSRRQDKKERREQREREKQAIDK